jgi:hypothetical protein
MRDIMATKKKASVKTAKKKKSPAKRTTKKKTPAAIHDDVLGKVSFASKLSPAGHHYTAEAKLARRSVEFHLYTDEKLDIMPAIQLAKDIVNNYAKISKDARAFFGKKVVPLYNSVWRDPKAPKGTAAMFDKVKLFEIDIDINDGITLVYDPGNMFWGHILWLNADLNMRFLDFDTPG